MSKKKTTGTSRDKIKVETLEKPSPEEMKKVFARAEEGVKKCAKWCDPVSGKKINEKAVAGLTKQLLTLQDDLADIIKTLNVTPEVEVVENDVKVFEVELRSANDDGDIYTAEVEVGEDGSATIIDIMVKVEVFEHGPCYMVFVIESTWVLDLISTHVGKKIRLVHANFADPIYHSGGVEDFIQETFEKIFPDDDWKLVVNWY